MDFDIRKIKEFDYFIMPHIGLTVFKYRAKGASLLKKINSDITIDQMIILKLLSINNNITQQDAADILYKDKSNLSRMVNSLEEKKYLIHKLASKNNRAVKLLSITDKGLQLLNKTMPKAYKLHDNAVKGITKQEFETVKRVMEKMRNNLDNEVTL